MNDLFGIGQGQLGLDLGTETPENYAPNPDEVRAELLAVLETARAAKTAAPWDRRTFRYHQTVFPQMAQWLPAPEGEQLCLAFAEEAKRIEQLMAA